MDFRINQSKLQMVIKITKATLYLSDQEIEDFILADWPEGDEHQTWLDEADAVEIADWVIAGNR